MYSREELYALTTEIVSRICAEADRGKEPEAVAKKLGLDASLVRDVVRMYVTHPGVTPEGVMAKLGL